MAYRAFDGWPFGVAAQRADEATSAAPGTEPVFSALEMSVVALAARDTAWSVRPRTRFVRIVEALFGIRRSNPLANPRLEALRRFAVIARTVRGAVPAPELQAFFAAGFSPRAATALSPLSR
ncbi:hypothetical protein [Sphingomonas colocasiae]|uniref:Uncharacterized protein n=1 Tax=Sphingomonas colocasiae TaxID=1848973 RepID=A0ABS7PMZ3_9SPHN|nr:hypothetical protein [Sphingomonas colocasiae]MBY8822364.1 hypothetical protein [Sphingomonas colocasiae]